MRKIKLKPFPEKHYSEIISEIGQFRYGLFSPDEALPGNIFSKVNGLEDCRYVLAGTGATVSDFVISAIEGNNLIIPKGSQVFVGRFLKYDASHGQPHFNAYDQIVFPTKGGNIFSFARNDAPDHFLEISELSHTRTLSEAYKLPRNKSGTIEEYKNSGASIYVEPEPLHWDGSQFVKVGDK
jgi:hypothetical protein